MALRGKGGQAVRLDRITMPEFEAGLEQSRTVILPFGSVEEHGPHLPLGTDTFQVQEVALRAAEKAGVFVAPPLPFGVCRSSREHPGTIGITTPVLRGLTIDLGRDFHRQGLRNLLLITGHAGKTHTMTLVDAGEALLDEFEDLNIAVVSEYMELLRAGRHLIETEDDSHAGEVETSRILFLHPDLVRGTAEEEYPSFPPHILVKDKRRYWRGGVWGNPGRATADKGRDLMEVAVENLVRIIRHLESHRP